MDIPIGVDEACSTQVCGRSTYLVINPVNDRVTHLAVDEKDFPHSERLVPVDYIVESTPTSIRLRCMPRELVGMDNLKLDKKAVARLPAIFVHRKWK